MQNDITNIFMLNTLGLPVITDLDTLSNCLGLSKRLIYLLSIKTENYYKSFTIPKKNGKSRSILSPSYSLKLVQRWILTEILEKISITDEAMAFKKGENKGIKKNAEYHKYSLYLLELDMQDFFTSINREKIFYTFKNIGYNKSISNIFANLCTYKGYLPQGGVTSPYLSNLVAYKIDKRLKQLCIKRDILYTRYADDLTFSSDNKEILKKVEPIIQEILLQEGFKINKTKTRFLSPKSHKMITGITVNDKRVKAKKQLKKKVRAMIHNSIISCDYKKSDEIRGYISFINYIEEGYRDKIIKYINRLITEKDYKYFIDSVEAYNSNKILKEAKDMVYVNLNLPDEHADSFFDGHNIAYYMDDYYLDEMANCRYDFLKEHGYIEEDVQEDVKEDVKIDNLFPF